MRSFRGFESPLPSPPPLHLGFQLVPEFEGIRPLAQVSNSGGVLVCSGGSQPPGSFQRRGSLHRWYSEVKK
eukprot:6685726-Pyramimonas_sp.AAC.1